MGGSVTSRPLSDTERVPATPRGPQIGSHGFLAPKSKQPPPNDEGWYETLFWSDVEPVKHPVELLRNRADPLDPQRRSLNLAR